MPENGGQATKVLIPAQRGPASSDRVSLTLLFTLAGLNAAAPLSTDMYLSSMPRIAEDLGVRPAQVQLTLMSFMLGLAAGQLVLGTLSDRYGRRRPLLVSTVVFVVSSVLCALAPSLGALMALRFVQGMSGAAGVVIGRAVVADSVRGVAAARAFSLLMVVGAIAPVVAPLAGTGIDVLAGWRAVFVSLAIFGALMLVGLVLVVKETLPPHRRVVGGAAASVRLAAGMVRDAHFVGYLLTLVLAFGALFAYVAASPFVVQEGLGLSAGQYALVFAVNSGGLIGAGAVSARLVGRVSPKRLLTCGVVVLAGCSFGALVVTGTGQVGTWTMLPLLFGVTASMGLIFGNGSSLAMATITTGAGTASAILGALQFGLGALVSPLVGLGGGHTALPMAVAMAVCAGGCVISLVTVGRLAPSVTDAVPDPAVPGVFDPETFVPEAVAPEAVVPEAVGSEVAAPEAAGRPS